MNKEDQREGDPEELIMEQEAQKVASALNLEADSKLFIKRT